MHINSGYVRIVDTLWDILRWGQACFADILLVHLFVGCLIVCGYFFVRGETFAEAGLLLMQDTCVGKVLGKTHLVITMLG